MATLRPCLQCGQPSPNAYCELHDHNRARRAQRIRVHGYRRKHWQKLRLERLALDGYRCQLRLARCMGMATHVHLSPALAGRHDLATLADCVSCCRSCSGDAGRAQSAMSEAKEV